MAKKNLASLMSGIMGDAKFSIPEETSSTTQEVPVSVVTEEMKEKSGGETPSECRQTSQG